MLYRYACIGIEKILFLSFGHSTYSSTKRKQLSALSSLLQVQRKRQPLKVRWKFQLRLSLSCGERPFKVGKKTGRPDRGETAGRPAVLCIVYIMQIKTSLPVPPLYKMATLPIYNWIWKVFSARGERTLPFPFRNKNQIRVVMRFFISGKRNLKKVGKS